jgi:hypothetical protein
MIGSIIEHYIEINLCDGDEKESSKEKNGQEKDS